MQSTCYPMSRCGYRDLLTASWLSLRGKNLSDDNQACLFSTLCKKTSPRSTLTMPERAGQRLGNYRLHRLLGKGSFAEVYLGEHLYLKNSAAIKILHTSLNEKDE